MYLESKETGHRYLISRCTRNKPPSYIQGVGFKKKVFIDDILVDMYTTYKTNAAVFFEFKESWFYCLDTKVSVCNDLKIIGFVPYEYKPPDVKRILERRQSNKERFFVDSDAGKSLAKQGKGDLADCTVKAIALVCGISYDEAYGYMKQIGRPGGDGYCLSNYVKHRKFFKWEFEPVVYKPNGNRISVKTFCEIYPKGKYLVFIKRHVQALIDGKIHDWGLKANAIVLHAVKLVE